MKGLMKTFEAPVDRNLPARKKDIMDVLRGFEKENRYTGHISVNVDPA
jgi:hypothetical protein